MVGERLKILRKGKGLSQKELAEAIGTSQGYICDIEQGKKMPGGDTLVSLKRFFEIDLDWFLTGEEKDPASLINPMGAEGVDVYGRQTLQISPRAAALVDNFEALSEEDKRAIERTAFALAESGKKVRGKTG